MAPYSLHPGLSAHTAVCPPSTGSPSHSPWPETDLLDPGELPLLQPRQAIDVCHWVCIEERKHVIPARQGVIREDCRGRGEGWERSMSPSTRWMQQYLLPECLDALGSHIPRWLERRHTHSSSWFWRRGDLIHTAYPRPRKQYTTPRLPPPPHLEALPQP